MKILLLITLTLAFPIEPVIDPIDAKFDHFLDYLDQLPTDQYTQLIDRLSGQFKIETGKSFDDLDKMTSDEYDEFVVTLDTKYKKNTVIVLPT